jgi:hypothetical protein
MLEMINPNTMRGFTSCIRQNERNIVKKRVSGIDRKVKSAIINELIQPIKK